MKPVKKATQKNVLINDDYYTEEQLIDMMNKPGFFTLPDDERDSDLRLAISFGNDLKVVLDEWGSYSTAAVHENGETYYVIL